jgi:lysozyme
MKRKVVKRNTIQRKSRKSKGSGSGKRTWLNYLLGATCLFFLFGIAFHYRSGLAYYLGFKSSKVVEKRESKRLTDVRNFQLLTQYSDKVVGIDVSQYQGQIQWNKVKTIEGAFPIEFVFIRATAGKDKVDPQFAQNWKESKHNKLLRGAYHFYRPNENSIAQATLFIRTVALQKGDLPPILDIESFPKNQPMDSLKAGLRRWLTKVDQHYGIKPIIYTNERYYEDFLKDDFSDFQFWIANYNFFAETMQDDWLFWQFTEKATIDGIEGNVDVNLYNGTPKMLHYLIKQ